jgi:hypothetical protein
MKIVRFVLSLKKYYASMCIYKLHRLVQLNKILCTSLYSECTFL